LLTQLRERQPELDELDVHLLGVATREDYQAQKLMDDGLGVELLLDPDDQIRRLLGSEQRFEWWRLLHPLGAASYLRAARQARRFDPIWAEATQRPGILLLDASLEVRWSKMGTRLGDYPTANEVIKAANQTLS